MSKREIRAKRLVAAVLLAISVQMWSAPPLWAVEASVQTETSAAGEAKETKDAKDAKAADSETGGEADAGEEETVVVPVIGYSTRSAAGSDYGVMPLADMAVDGALTGVTGINGSELVVDKVNNNFFIGTTEYGGSFDKNSKNNAAIGLDIRVDQNGNNSVFGIEATGWGESVSVFGYNATADNFGSSFGAGARSEDGNGSAFGYNAEAWGGTGNSAFGYNAKAISGGYGVAVGAEAKVESAGGIAIGGLANVEDTKGSFIGGIAIGQEAHTNNERSIAIGYDAESTLKNSIAIGAESNTTAENQVSFGTAWVNIVDGEEVIEWTARRSLAGISDIEMAGALTGVTSINGSVLAAMNEDVTNKSLAIGAGAVFMDPDSSVTTISKNAIAIGNGTKVLGDGSLAIGYYAYQRVGAFAGGIESIAINGWVSLEANYNIAIGGSVVDADNVVAIGYNAASDSSNAVAIGSNTYASYDGTALGYAAQGTYHNAVAIGAYSGTTEENQVSFGHKVGDRNYADGSDYSDDLFRSLINVADIDMHGNISLGGEWKENTTSGLYESNGKGELNGVTSINGVIFAKDSMNNDGGLLIGTLASGTSFYGDTSVMIGLNIDNSAIDAVGIGNNIKLTGDGSVAIGYGAEAMSNMAMYPTAIGFSARAIGDEVVAIGGSSYAVHEFSVALGDDSSTSAENQVSFGHKDGDKYGDGGRDTYGSDLFRSLVNVADIEMHGALTGVTGIDGVTVSGTDASTGLTVGGNAVIGKTDTPFSSTGFAVAKDGAVTAKTVNGATITGTGFNGVTLSTDGKVNGAVITSNSFNGVTLEKGADSHYKVGGVDVTKMQTDVAGKADAATTLTGYGITDAYTKTETDTAVGKKADKATTLTGYGIADAYTKTETDTAIGKKADKATTLTGYGIADAYTKTETDTAIGKKADKATTLTGYGITDAYTKTAADAKITAATADMATKTQVTADIGTAKTALESAYQAADTALSDRAAALETAATGMSYDAGKNTTTFTGGVTATVLTAGEFKVGATGFGFGNDGALTAKTVNGIEIKKDESKVMVGGIDLTALSNGDVVTDNTKGIGRNQDTATTTIETNTAISSSGITTNAVTASGTVKAGEFVEGSQKLSDKYAAKTALADYTTTTDMNTKFADYATTTAVDTKLADYAKSDSVYSKAAADTAFAKAGDVDTLKTTVGDTDGGLVKDVKDLQSGKADNATTLAGYGIADAYTQTEINEKIVEATKDLATSATVTDIQSGLEEVTGKTAGLSYDTASGSSKFSGSVVIGNEGAKTHTQITDDAIIFGEGTDKQVTVDASGIHVGKKAAGGIALYADADGTHIDHTSLVTGSVTADNLNGVAISGNATDGLSVGGVSIKALSERLDSLEQDGVATADMGGIKRTDVVENSGKTIIEDTTSFTKDGLKTANLEAATAALGGVNFAAGAVTGVSSINGVVFGSDGKIGGVSLSGGKVDGVDVGWLDQRVKSLEDNGTGGGGTGGGGSSANTSGIHKPDGDTTTIEGNTSITTDGIDTNKVNASDSIVVADGEKNKTVISKDGILVAEGEKNQVKINEDGIHVGKNSSVVNDTDGFITDKGLYIGVSSSSDTSTAKFSVAPNGNLSSKAGDYGFSNTSADGAKFTHSGDTAYGTGSQLDTTIQGNKVTTGRIDTDELYVDGNKVTVAGGTISQTDAVNNHLSGADADGNTVTNDFKTSAVNGTTQAAEKTSADGKESTKTVNNTSAGGTGVTTSKTTTDSKDNVTVKESSFGTNEKGMTLSTSNKVTDKDGKVTKDTSGTTTMTGDSISVSKTTTTTEKDADGNEKEVTKTSGTTIGSGEVTLKREDGSTIEVGSAIEGMQSDMRELDGRVNRMGVEIKEVGALSAALAGLHPQPENANSRADFAMAMGSYEGKQALAVGGFYRPDKRTMLSIGASTTSSKHMMNMGISIALDRLPEAERKAKEAAKAAGVEQETLNRVLERLAALEQDNRRLQADNEKRDVAYEKLAADYTQLKEKYIEETADRQQPEQAEAEE